jgi:hypothetical protein
MLESYGFRCILKVPKPSTSKAPSRKDSDVAPVHSISTDKNKCPPTSTNRGKTSLVVSGPSTVTQTPQPVKKKVYSKMLGDKHTSPRSGSPPPPIVTNDGYITPSNYESTVSVPGQLISNEGRLPIAAFQCSAHLIYSQVQGSTLSKDGWFLKSTH